MGVSSIGVLGGGLRGRVQVGGRGWFLVGMGEKGKGVGRVGAWGGDRHNGTSKSTRTRLSKLPYSKLPLSFSPIWMGNSFGRKYAYAYTFYRRVHQDYTHS